MSWFLGCLVSWLLAFLVSWCLCFLGGKEGEEGRRGTKEGGRKKWKEARKEGEERTRGRKARKEGNIAPKCGLWGSKMHPKRPQTGSLEASGRPLASLGGPRLFFSDFQHL